MKDVAAALLGAGVRAAFGVPGSGASLALLSAFEERGAPTAGVAHEAAAVLMAGGFFRASASPACAVSIKGPGVGNLLPGLLAARYEQWPILSASECYGGSERVRMHKRLDHAAALAPMVKCYATLGGDPAEVTARLIRCAGGEVPGPAHLDLASDGGGFVEARPPARAKQHPPQQLDRIRRSVDAAKRPVVIAGSLAARQAWGARLASLRIPVLTTVAAKGVVDEQTAWAAGVFTGAGGADAPERAVLAEADLVVGLGLRALEVLDVVPFGRPCVVLDAAADEHANAWEPDAVLSSATRAQFEELLDALAAREWGAPLVREVCASLRGRLARPAWLPGALFAELEDVFRARGTLVVDTGLFCTVAEHVYRAATPQAFLASANGRYMGTALPMALGAALARPDRPVVCTVGDGGLPPYLAELRLAIERRLPLLLLLLSDGGYASVASAISDASAASQKLLRVGRPSWLAAVDGMGCAARQAAGLDEFASVVRGWRPDSGPLFLEARFDPEAYRTMTRGVR
jgi:acetolactate synthase-1/2/3 large subunit